tara:strand:+ start:2483 stop:4846 length:2364 start_codon:yes stop_codon:yes gene_type:complete
MKKIILNNYFTKLIFLFFISIILDLLWLKFYDPTPGWDQGYHLSNAFKMANIYENRDLETWDSLLNVTTSYRGPLTYFLTSFPLKLFGNSYIVAFLSNQIFNLICMLSIFELGKELKSKSLGLWATIIFIFSPFFVNQRTDYLIDFSLTAFCSLAFLTLTKWLLDKNEFSKYGFLSGFCVGLIFLVKPTGISILFLPIISLFIYKFLRAKNKALNLIQIIVFLSIFFITIYPWFSKNWLTIISSTFNAWKWGINYQDGLDFNDLSSWIYYIKQLPKIIGALNFGILGIIFLNKINKKELGYNFPKNKKLNTFNIIYFLNTYIILSLMSTKDIRFFMPIYPIVCLYIPLILSSSRVYIERIQKKIIVFSLLITLFSYQYNFIINFSGLDFKVERNNKNKYHYEVINEIKKENPFLVSTLAVLPDTKEINTFNLEAEASRQKEYVAVRQVISNKESYKNDLEYFDWFITKSGAQGIMTSESKTLLNKYLKENNSFVVHKEWELPNSDKLFLFKRKILNSYVKGTKCNTSGLKLKLKGGNNVLEMNVISKGEDLKNSNLYLDNKTNNSLQIISLANGMFHNTFEEDKCYELTQYIPSNINENNKYIDAKIVNSKNDKLIFYKKNIEITFDGKSKKDMILMANKIDKVNLLGNYLKNGEFEKLFNLVGIINQSDPRQAYLRNSEIIFKEIYKNNNEINDLYNVLISQILQRKAKEAKETAEILLKNDEKNPNLFIAKTIINVYLFDIKDARFSIDKAKDLNDNSINADIIKTIDNVISILELDIDKGLKIS